jgi:LPXTG-site transpeptidase (sortase) family protein
MKNIRKYRVWGLALVAVLTITAVTGNSLIEEEPPELAFNDSLFLGKATLKEEGNAICNLQDIPPLALAQSRNAPNYDSEKENLKISSSNDGLNILYYTDAGTQGLKAIADAIKPDDSNKVLIAYYENLNIDGKTFDEGFKMYPLFDRHNDLQKFPGHIQEGTPFFIFSCKDTEISNLNYHGKFHYTTEIPERISAFEYSRKSGWTLNVVPRDFFAPNERGYFLRNMYQNASAVWLQSGKGYEFTSIKKYLRQGDFEAIQELQEKSEESTIMWVKFKEGASLLSAKLPAASLLNEEQNYLLAQRDFICQRRQDLYRMKNPISPYSVQELFEKSFPVPINIVRKYISNITEIEAKILHKNILHSDLIDNIADAFKNCSPEYLSRLENYGYDPEDNTVYFGIRADREVSKKALKVGKGKPKVVRAVTADVGETVNFSIDVDEDISGYVWSAYSDLPREEIHCPALIPGSHSFSCTVNTPGVFEVRLRKELPDHIYRYSESIYIEAPEHDYMHFLRANLIIPIVDLSSDELRNRRWSDLSNETLEEIKEGIFHYPGTSNPGEIGNTIFTGAQSYLVANPSIKTDGFTKLNSVYFGDEIRIYLDGEEYSYKVSDIKSIVAGNTEALMQTANEQLTLISKLNYKSSDQDMLVITATPVLEINLSINDSLTDFTLQPENRRVKFIFNSPNASRYIIDTDTNEDFDGDGVKDNDSNFETMLPGAWTTTLENKGQPTIVKYTIIYDDGTEKSINYQFSYT